MSGVEDGRKHANDDHNHNLSAWDDALPPALPFKQSRRNAKKLKVWISNHPPYRILDMSAELESFLEFDFGEVQNRAINVLFGPETNPHTLTLAIKQVTVNPENETTTSISSFKIYGRNGASHEVSVVCSTLACPNVTIDSKCCLIFECRGDPSRLSDVPRDMRKSTHSQHRVQNNFITGLDMHLSRLLSSTSESHSCRPECDWSRLLS